MRTVLSLGPITRRYSKTAFMRALLPTTSDSMVTKLPGKFEVMTASRHLQGVEFRNLRANRRFDAVVQRHVRSRTSGAHADQANRCRAAVDGDEFDIAAVGLQKGTNAIENGLDSFFVDGHGGCSPNRRPLNGRPTRPRATAVPLLESRKYWRIVDGRIKGRGFI